MTRARCQGGALDVRVQKKAEPHSLHHVVLSDICVGTAGAGQPVCPFLSWAGLPASATIVYSGHGLTDCPGHSQRPL